MKRFDSNNYELNPGKKTGVYLIHGFSSTTYELKLLGELLGADSKEMLLIIQAIEEIRLQKSE